MSTDKPEKVSAAKKAKSAEPRDPNQPSTREISRVVSFYEKNVRNDGKVIGIFRQIQLMLNKGVTLGQISQAVQNYAKADFTRSLPEPRRHSIRKFMKPEVIRQWAGLTNANAADKSLSTLQKLTDQAIAAQQAAPEIPTWKPEEEEEEPCQAEI